MKDYFAQDWEAVFEFNRLDDFGALWNLKLQWYEPPNARRGGWSAVARLDLDLPQGGTASVFLKRQENHVRKTLRHPWRGVATYEQEFKNILQYHADAIPSLTPIYFAKRDHESGLRAILVTLALDDYLDMKQLSDQWQQHGRPRQQQRTPILLAVAQMLAHMHAQHIQHNSCYPKHLFIHRQLMDCSRSDPAMNAAPVRIIDLESSRKRIIMRRARLRDLDSLNRYSPQWSRSDRLRFLLAYLAQSRLDRYGRKIWRQLASRSLGKRTTNQRPAAVHGDI